MKLITKRLLIRPIELKDADSLFEYKSQKEITKFQGKQYESIDDVLELIKRNPKELNIENTWYQLVLVEQKTKDIIGDIGLHFLGPKNMQLEIGITISPSHKRKGYAREAIKAIVDYAFSKLEKHRIFVSIDPKNLPSVALFENLDFKKEAHFKESYFQNGIWNDDVIYAVLRSEHK